MLTVIHNYLDFTFGKLIYEPGKNDNYYVWRIDHKSGACMTEKRKLSIISPKVIKEMSRMFPLSDVECETFTKKWMGIQINNFEESRKIY